MRSSARLKMVSTKIPPGFQIGGGVSPSADGGQVRAPAPAADAETVRSSRRARCPHRAVPRRHSVPPLRRYRNGPRPTRGRTLCAPTASSELVLLARQSQAQVWSRTRPKFLQTQGPVAREEPLTATQILCAGRILPGPRGNPRNGGPGVSGPMGTKCPSAASPGDPLVSFPSLGKKLAPQGETLPCRRSDAPIVKRRNSIIAPSSGPFGATFPPGGRLTEKGRRNLSA